MAATATGFYSQELDREQLTALFAAREVTVNELVEGLYHGQALVRRNASRGAALVDALPDPGHALLRIGAHDVDAEVRLAIVMAMALGDYPVDLAIPILFDALLDPVEDISEQALQGLELRMNRAPDAVIPLLSVALRDVRPLVASTASALLIKANERAVAALVPLLGDHDAAVRRTTFDIFERIRWSAIPELIAALQDSAARPLAARLLEGAGELTPTQLAALEAHLLSPDAALAEAATAVLAGTRRARPAPPRTAPLDVPIDGFLERALDAAALEAAVAVPVAVSELLYALRDGRDPVRANAAGLLARRVDARDQATATLAALAPALRDPAAIVRRAACDALGHLGGPIAVRGLVRALGDADAAVTQIASDGLVALGVDAVPAALDALSRDLPARVPDALVDLVARIGGGATAALADALSGALSSATRVVAARALGALGKAAEDAIASLLRGLADPSEEVRAASAHALGFVGVDDPTILAALGQALHDPVAIVRRRAAIAAARITGRPLDDRGAEDAVPIPIAHFETEPLAPEVLAAACAGLTPTAFLSKLRDGRALVRRNAALALSSFGPAAAEAAEPLALVLRDADVEVRRAALTAFEALGEAAAPAAYWLLGATADPDPEAAERAVTVLAGLFEVAGDFLIEGLRVDRAVAETTVLRVFVRLEARGVPLLKAALKNGSALIRVNAARALELIAKKGGDAALSELEARLADPVGDVRAAASAAIDAIKGGVVKPPKVLEPEPIAIAGFMDGLLAERRLRSEMGAVTVERLVRALRDGRPYVRHNAATLLGHFGADGELAVGPLAVSLKDSVVAVRVAAAEALGRLGQVCDGPAASVLVSALTDPAPSVVEAATAALDGLGARALDALVAGLARPADLAGRTVLPILARHTEAARDRLGEALADPSPTVRASAARGLLLLGRELAATTRARVDAATRDPDDAVRAEARAAIDYIDKKDLAPAALEPLALPIAGFETEPLSVATIAAARGDLPVSAFAAKLRDGRPVVRLNAARGLEGFGPAAEEAVESLAVLLRDGDAAVRKAAVMACRALGEAAALAVPWLCGVAGEDDVETASTAIEVLAALHEVAAEALTEGLRVDPDVAPKTILRVFVRLEGRGVPLLKAALKNGSGLIRMNAARALEAIARKGADAATDDLEARLSDSVGAVRAAASDALDAIKGGRPRPPVVFELDPVPIPGFMDRALEDEALAGQVGATTVDRMLVALRDGRPYVRHNAALALGHFGAEAAAAVGPLAVTLKDTAILVRQAAATALGRLCGVVEGPVAAILVSALADPAPAVMEAARAALDGLGDAALPALAAGLGRGVDAAAATVLPLIARRGAAGAAVLEAALNDNAPRLRAAAARGFTLLERELAGASRAAVDRATRDPDDAVRAEARAARDYIDKKDLAPAALEAPPLPIPGFESEPLTVAAIAAARGDLPVAAFAAKLRDGRPVVRLNAARGLEGFGPAAEEAVEAVAVLLRDGEPAVRKAAVMACLAFGEAAAPAVPWLCGAAGEDDAETASIAVEVLAALHHIAGDALIEGLRVDPDVAPKTILRVFVRLEARGVKLLRAALKNGSGLIRINAARALEAIAKKGADEATEELEARLADPVGAVRAAASDALDAIKGGRPRPPVVLEPEPVEIPGFLDRTLEDAALAGKTGLTTVERMLRALRDGRAYVRHNAVRLLGHYGAAAGPAVGPLAVALKDTAVVVRQAAAVSLGRLGGQVEGPVAAILVSALSDPAPAVVEAARAALDGLGDAALPALSAGLGRGVDVAAGTVAPLIARRGPAGAAALVAALGDPSPRTRAAAARGFTQLERELAGASREAVERATHDPDDAVRAEARAALDYVDKKDLAPAALEPVPLPIAGFEAGPLSVEAIAVARGEVPVSAFVAKLRDGRPVVRENAARALEGFGPGAAEAVEALAMLLRDGEVAVRRAAVSACLALGEAAAPAVPWLCGAAGDEDVEVAATAVDVLVALHNVAFDALTEGLRVDPEVAPKTILRVFVRLEARGVPLLKAALKNGSGLIRINAARALEAIAKKGADDATEELEARLADPVGAVRAAASDALDAIKGGRPRPPVVLEPEPVDIAGFMDRALTAEALAGQGGATTVERMLRALRDGRAYVRHNAALVLGDYGAAASPAVGPLAVALKDGSILVREAAAIALGRLGGAVEGPVAAILVSALSDPAPAVAAAARRGLAGLGEAALPAFVAALARGADAASVTVLPLMAALGAAGALALGTALGDPSPRVRAAAARGFAGLERDLATATRAAVVAALRDPDDAVRAEARVAVDYADGKDLVPVALEPLPLPHEQFATHLLVKEVLAAALDALEPGRVMQALYDGRWLVRANAATALGVLGARASGATPHLVMALKDARAEVRRRAADALASQPPDRNAAFDLVIALDDASPPVVEAAERALVAYGDDAIEAYLYALDNLPSLVARAVLPMLARLEKKAVDPLVAALSHDASAVRQNALIGLRLLGPKVARGARAAVSLAGADEARDVRLQARKTLDFIDGVTPTPLVREPLPLPLEGFDLAPITAPALGKARAKLEPALLELLLRDGRRVVRENAARSLGVLGRVGPGLGLALKDSVPAVRLAAAQALVASGTAAAVCGPSLVGALADREPEVRAIARDLLEELGRSATSQVWEALRDGLRVPPQVVVRTVLPVLVAIGAPVVPLLLDTLEDVSAFVRLNALGALARMRGQGVAAGRARIEGRLLDPLDAIRRTAQLVLDKLDDKVPGPVAREAVALPAGFEAGPLEDAALEAAAKGLDFDWLIGALADGRPFVRENAARALGFGAVDPAAAVAALTRSLKDSLDPVRVAAATGLGALKAAPEVAVPALAQALRGASPELGGAALEALAAFGPERVVGALVGHLEGREEVVVESVGRAARAMPKAFTVALAKVASDAGQNLIARENAVSILGDLGVAGRGAEGALLGLLTDMQGMLAVKAVKALAHGVGTPGPEVCGTLTQHLLRDPRPSMHYAVRDAVRVLKRKHV